MKLLCKIIALLLLISFGCSENKTDSPDEMRTAKILLEEQTVNVGGEEVKIVSLKALYLELKVKYQNLSENHNESLVVIEDLKNQLKEKPDTIKLPADTVIVERSSELDSLIGAEAIKWLSLFFDCDGCDTVQRENLHWGFTHFDSGKVIYSNTDYIPPDSGRHFSFDWYYKTPDKFKNLDDFINDNNTLIANHSKVFIWKQLSTSPAIILNNQLTHQNNNQWVQIRTSKELDDNHWAEIEVIQHSKLWGNYVAGVTLRGNLNNQACYVLAISSRGNTDQRLGWEIRKINPDGNYNFIQSNVVLDPQPTLPYKLRGEVEGNVLKLYLNGELITQRTDNTYPAGNYTGVYLRGPSDPNRTSVYNFKTGILKF